MAYINNDLPEMESCIDNLYAYFPFLETHSQYSEAVKTFWIANRSDNYNAEFTIEESPSIHWQYIHAHILFQSNKTMLAQKQLQSIIKATTNTTEIPLFYINQLLKQISSK
jgi:hypothetical protein